MPSPLIIKIQEQERHLKIFLGIAPEGTPKYNRDTTIIDIFKKFNLDLLTELDRELSKMKLCSEDGDGEWDYYIGHDHALTLVRARLSEAIKELGE